MQALLDANIFLEILLAQENAESAKALLSQSAHHQFFITDYSLHSIGVLLFRMKKRETFSAFIEDVLINGGVRLLALRPDEMSQSAIFAEKFGLDFDDAYQYTKASHYKLTLVSFDSDFRRTDSGCKTPAEILREI
ncbi:MAG: type II toxin-antitoxin system VapC family toxin [Anaerolineales bacterium]